MTVDDSTLTLEARERGGPAAIRGYRLQVLYALDLLLSGSVRVRLEGLEDVDLLDSDDLPVEVMQVKAHSTPLAMSMLRSESGKTSFWERLRDLSVGQPSIRGTVVSFGEVGPELKGALDCQKTHRDSVVRKLRDDYSVSEPEDLLARVALHEEIESELTQRLTRQLQALCPAASAATSMRLLSSWLLLRAELRAIVTSSEVQQQLEHAGVFATECRAYAEEWFRTIVPLETSSSASSVSLATEFYEGIAARYEHIVANVDVARPRMLSAINAGFAKARVVVLHGASGEGKSTLLFRYAQSCASQCYRYLVDVDADLTRSLSIATALASFARHASDEVLLLLDARPGNRHWPTVVEALAGVENLRVLIGVREEDWREAYSLSYRARVEDVAVRLELDEAHEIFDQLQATRAGESFVSFEDAWAKFGGAGPMLEFVHLITRHESLRARLQQQVRALLDGLTEQESEFCRLAACGTGYGGRVVAQKLMSAAGLGPTRATTLMTRLEEEYFVRRAAAGDCVEAVHPIRSRVLCELLFNDAFCPLSNGLTKVAQIVHDDDLERLLFESFLICTPEHLVVDEAVRIAGVERTFSWRTCAGIARALLWLDLSAYVRETRAFVALAELILPGAWRFLLPWHFAPGWASETTEAVADARRMLLKQHPERNEAAEKLAKSVPVLSYRKLEPFLKRDWTAVSPPNGLADWISLCEVAYWHKTIEAPQPGPLSSVDERSEIPQGLPLQLQAELVSFTERLGGVQWMAVFERVVKRYRIVWLDDSAESLRAVFLVGAREGRELIERGTGALNARAVAVSSVMRALIPGREGYGCLGVAWPHQFTDHNPIEKQGIKAHHLEAKWSKRVLPVIMQLIERSTFPASWKEHAERVRAFRQGFLESIRSVLIQCALEPTWNGQWLPERSQEARAEWTDGAPAIPNCARDPWCVGNFGWDEDQDDNISWFHERYRAYSASLQSFHTAASALVRELFTSGEGERDWTAALRLGISCWQELPKLHAVDRTPFRPWWPDVEVDRHGSEERMLLAELVAVIDAKSKGGVVQPRRALQDMYDRVAALLAEICGEIANEGCDAVHDFVPSETDRSAAVIISPRDTSSVAAVDRELAVAKQACWRVLTRRCDVLRTELQVVAERINLLVTANRVAIVSFPVSTLSAIVGNEAGFLGTMGREADDAECLARGLRRCGSVAEREKALSTLTLCAMAAVDMMKHWTPAWNQHLAEQCLGEIVDDARGAVSVLLRMAESTVSTRSSLVEVTGRLTALCTVFLDENAESPPLDELCLTAMTWTAESTLDDALRQ